MKSSLPSMIKDATPSRICILIKALPLYQSRAKPCRMLITLPNVRTLSWNTPMRCPWSKSWGGMIEVFTCQLSWSAQMSWIHSWRVSFPWLRVLSRVSDEEVLTHHICFNVLTLLLHFYSEERHQAIEEIRKYLIPGAKSKSGKDLLPALGFVLNDSKVRVGVKKLPLPVITAAGVRVPESAGGMWAPQSKMFIMLSFFDCRISNKCFPSLFSLQSKL